MNETMKEAVEIISKFLVWSLLMIVLIAIVVSIFAFGTPHTVEITALDIILATVKIYLNSLCLVVVVVFGYLLIILLISVVVAIVCGICDFADALAEGISECVVRLCECTMRLFKSKN